MSYDNCNCQISYDHSNTIINDLNNTVAYLKEENTRLKDDIKKLTKQLEEQSIIESGEKAILDIIYNYIEISNREDTQFTQLYQLDFIPAHYRMIVDKTVKDYLVNKGVKDNINNNTESRRLDSNE